MISVCIKCVSAPRAAVSSIAMALSMTREVAEMCPKAGNGACQWLQNYKIIG